MTAAFRDRIKELRRVKAGDLVVNEKNWREHDRRQQDAMLELLSEVGYADALIAYEVTGGKLKLINGHMRAGLTPESEVPVLVLDVSEEEADKLLATFDPVSSFAVTNKEKLKSLLDTLKINNHDMRHALSTMAADTRNPNQSVKAIQRKQQAEQILEMELKPLEHYDYIIVMARNTTDWNRIVDIFHLQQTRKPGASQIGMCRAVDASMLLKMLDDAKAKQAPAEPAKEKKAK